MRARFVCLANSFKHGGRCLAGISLDASDRPVTRNGHPQWIRPVFGTIEGAVPTGITYGVDILDVIEVELAGPICGMGYQSENALMATASLNRIGKFPFHDLGSLCQAGGYIFGNRGKAVIEEKVQRLNHSLTMVRTDQLQAIEREYHDSIEKHQVRLVFTFAGVTYDLPITDPAFLRLYKSNASVLDNVSSAYIVLSLALKDKDWHSKLVAGVIF